MINTPEEYMVKSHPNGFYCVKTCGEKQFLLLKDDGSIKLFPSSRMATLYARMHSERGLQPEQEISSDDFRAYFLMKIVRITHA